MDMPIIGCARIAQVCIVTRDVEATKQKYAALYGVEAPKTVDSGSFEIAQTEYHGVQSPETGCYMAIFNLDNLQMEVIQPKPGRSEWGDFLDKHGEGLHHIAFRIKDIKSAIARCEAAGMKLTQYGLYNDASGAYAYMDAYDQFKCTIELLEDYDK